MAVCRSPPTLKPLPAGVAAAAAEGLLGQRGVHARDAHVLRWVFGKDLPARWVAVQGV